MKQRAWPLIAVGLLFFGPFVLAVLLYVGRDSFGGFGQLSNPDRELLEDPLTIPLEPLDLADGTRSEPAWSRGRWSLVYARTGSCDADCVRELTRTHAIWLALGAERDRVQLLLLVAEQPDPAPMPADALVGRIDTPANAALVRLLDRERLASGRYFVVDPLGNVILSYPATADQGRLLEDLERLLEVSRVG